MWFETSANPEWGQDPDNDICPTISASGVSLSVIIMFAVVDNNVCCR